MDLRKAENELKSIYMKYESLRKSEVATTDRRNVSLSMIPKLSSFEEENEEEENKVVVAANEALSRLESLRNQIMTLEPKIEKIKKRMKEVGTCLLFFSSLQ